MAYKVAVLKDSSAGYQSSMPFLKINSKKKKKVSRSANNLWWEKVNMAFAKEMVLLKSAGVFE